MSSFDSLEFPPILGVGFHHMPLPALRKLCVDGFGPLSSTRDEIMTGFENVVQILDDGRIAGEIWLNGSFFTDKIDPADIDGSLCIPHDVWQSASAEQRSLIAWINPANLKTTYRCDLYAWIEYPKGHPDYDVGQWLRSYWHRQWGFSRAGEMKGIAVVSLPIGAQ